MKINSLLQEGITTASSPDNAQSPAPHFGRSDKVLEDSIEECTTSGSVATVASPVGGVQRRGKGSIFSGIKTSDKFANSQSVKEETTDEGFLGFGSDAPAQPKKKLDYAAARRMSQQANPKMTKQYHPDEYIKKYGAFAEEDELDENSMADFFAKAAQEKFPNALIRKNGETVQEPPKREIPQQSAPQAPVDVAELERQYAALEKRYEQLGGDSWQYADRMMDRDYEARDVGRQLRVLADRIQKAKGIEEARKANTKTARKGLAKREKRADPTMDAKKKSEQDAAWERLQAYMNKPENMAVLKRLSTNEQGVAEDQVNEKSKSQAQFRTMAAVAHNPEFAKKVGISQKVGKEFHKADKKSDYEDLPARADEEKQRLDPKCWTGYKKQGTKMKGGVRVNNCVKVDEAEFTEDKLAQELYKDLQIFKKGADKDIGSKAKDKEIGQKPKDKDIIAKEAANAAQQAAIAIAKKKEQGVEEDWQKTNRKDKTDGMSPKAVKAYRRENPGSKLQTAVTKKPSELKAGSKDAKRRKSFCARMSGVEGPMKDEKGRPTPKAKALKRWNC